jgi:hypothetical protein
MKVSALLLTGLMGFVFIAHAQEEGWPQELRGEDGSVVIIYQPQVEKFTGNELEARAAVSVKVGSAESAPVFGAIWMLAKLDTNRDNRMAIIRDITVSDVRFADATDEAKQQLGDFIERRLEGASLEISVDQLLADLEAADSDFGEAELKHEPPIIIVATEPALLVSIDGDPVFQDIEGSTYERVVNSAFLIVQAGSVHYLYVGSNVWYQASDVTGTWTVATAVPSDISSLVEKAEDDGDDPGPMKIIIATEPTELVVVDGDPSWAPVEGMDLLYMDNTDSNAFLELTTQRYYVLLSGRWYRSEGMSGELNWVHVPNDELPMPFSDIPVDSVNGSVLAQVAGTQEARDAVLDNTIPQTAAIDRDSASFSVSYDGEPDFAPIEDIQVQYAQNTTAAVFKYGNLYYACDDGVWYVANSAGGSWTVATEVPDAIYKIPASNPHHNVTYVKVYDVTPEVVYVGYTPSYYGSYYYHGAVVYGTGWYYQPWYGPYYYPRYPTWGFHVSYNPWTGWGVGVSWTNGPFRFTFSTHGSWWGVGGYHPYRRAHIYGGYRKTNVNININNNINIGGRPGNRPETRPNLYDRPENRSRNAERPATANTRQARPASNVQNNVLTDRSGNVYQRGNDGQWNQRSDGQWTSSGNLDRSTANAAAQTRQTDRSTGNTASSSQMGTMNRTASSGQSATQRSTYGTASSSQRSSQQRYSSAARPQLERDYSARQQGAQRTQSYRSQGGGRRRR